MKCSKVTEFCPYCETESEYEFFEHKEEDTIQVMANMIQSCRNCGKTITICSMCKEQTNCNACIYFNQANFYNYNKKG